MFHAKDFGSEIISFRLAEFAGEVTGRNKRLVIGHFHFHIKNH